MVRLHMGFYVTTLWPIWSRHGTRSDGIWCRRAGFQMWSTSSCSHRVHRQWCWSFRCYNCNRRVRCATFSPPWRYMLIFPDGRRGCSNRSCSSQLSRCTNSPRRHDCDASQVYPCTGLSVESINSDLCIWMRIVMAK